MALIYQGTTTNTGKIRVAKNCGSLVVISSTPINFANATISAYIERSSSNEEICTDVPFIDYLMLNKVGEVIRNFQTDSIASGDRFSSIEFDFGSDAGLFIAQGDVLVFELKTIGTGTTKIYSLDDMEYKNSYRKHEVKNMLADEKQRTFQVLGSEFVLISSNVDKIRSVVMRMTNGERLEYVEDELRHLMSGIMPNVGRKEITISTVPIAVDDYIKDMLLIPTFDVVDIEIHRATTGLIPVHMQYDVSFAPTGYKGKPLMPSTGTTKSAGLVTALEKAKAVITRR